MPLGLGAGLLLILVGAWLNQPVLGAVGIVVGGAALVHRLWARYGLDGVEYRRHLERTRASFGDEIAMTVEVWNGKRLPLAWLRADDETSPGVEVRGAPGADPRRSPDEDPEHGGRELRNTWTLAPFERVRRRVWVSADRRGLFSIGPTELAVGDLFARVAARSEIDHVDRFIVWPRVVPAVGVTQPHRWGELERARRGLLEDPTRFAGVRSYSAGDPLRRLHHRASARLGVPVTKRFEPARERQLVVALDVRTGDEPEWAMADDEALEELCVVGASIARSLAAEQALFAFTAAAYTRTRQRFADVPLGRGAQHADRVLDVLARLSHHASATYEVLLARIPRRFRTATSVLAVTRRDPLAVAPGVARLRHAGFAVSLLCCGPDAVANARAARAAGFDARAAELDGDWRTATRLVTVA
jgi:uncharacterized protein (DUF58 family)